MNSVNLEYGRLKSEMSVDRKVQRCDSELKGFK